MQRFSDDDILSGAPLAVELREVRFHEVDAASTVYFARFFEWCADVYVARLVAGGFDLRGALSRREAAAPFAHAEADFRHPLYFGDRCQVELSAVRIGRSSYSLGFRVLDPSERARVYALVRSTHVAVDPSTMRPVPVPETLRAALEGST